jgi:hypothetical protein
MIDDVISVIEFEVVSAIETSIAKDIIEKQRLRGCIFLDLDLLAEI